MNWIQPVDAVDLIWKGLVIGVVVSAPMGPVGVLCVQRTLNKGRWFGFVTGIGAALSDILYALVTGFALSYVVDFIEDGRNMFYLQALGSVMLFVFGLYTFRTNPSRNIRPVSSSKGTLVHNLVTAFFVTLSNPLIIFLFLGLFARFGFVVPDHRFEQAMGYLSILGGALCWWFVLTYAINKLRSRFDLRGIWLINRIIGVVVMVVSVVGLVLTVTGKTLY